jgi:hypothetical protein
VFDPKTQKQPKPNNVVAPKSSPAPAKVAMMPDAGPSQDIIKERAYELYEARGREPGQDEQDWLRAEQDLLKRGRSRDQLPRHAM